MEIFLILSAIIFIFRPKKYRNLHKILQILSEKPKEKRGENKKLKFESRIRKISSFSAIS